MGDFSQRMRVNSLLSKGLVPGLTSSQLRLFNSNPSRSFSKFQSFSYDEQKERNLIEKTKTEIKYFIQKTNLEEKSSFDIINELLQAGQKESIMLTEDIVQENITFFQQLFEKLKVDLKNEEIPLSKLIEAMQFSQVLNYDDMGVWEKLVYLTVSRIKKSGCKIEECYYLFNIVKKDSQNLIPQQAKQTLKNETEDNLKTIVEKERLEELGGNQLIQAVPLIMEIMSRPDWGEEEGGIAEKLDNELARRLEEGELKNEEISNICVAILEHNQACPSSYEVFFEAFLLCLEDAIIKGKDSQQDLQLVNLNNEELIAIVGAYMLSGNLLKDLPQVVEKFQEEIKHRLLVLNLDEVAYLLKLFSQGQEGTAEFYGLLDRYFGQKSDHIPADLLLTILQSFYESGHARPKLFLKLQKKVIQVFKEGGEDASINDLCAILRIYSEMSGSVEAKEFGSTSGVSFSLFESLVHVVEKGINQMDELAFVNALVAFKNVEIETKKANKQLLNTLKPLLVELESILLGNLFSMSLPSKCALLFTYSTPTSSSVLKINQNPPPTALTQKLLSSVLQDLKNVEMVSELQSHDVFQLIFAFQRLQVAPQEYLAFSNQIESSLEYFSDDHLKMIGQIYEELSNQQEGFDATCSAIIHEIEKRKDIEEES